MAYSNGRSLMNTKKNVTGQSKLIRESSYPFQRDLKIRIRNLV